MLMFTSDALLPLYRSYLREVAYLNGFITLGINTSRKLTSLSALMLFPFPADTLFMGLQTLKSVF